MKTQGCIAFLVLILAGIAAASGAEPKRPADDRAAIMKTVESYVAAYNRGDAKALAAHWSDEGQWLSPDGRRIRGRRAIEAAMAKMFQEEKGRKIEIVNAGVRLVSADAAVEEGTARVSSPGEPATESTYLAVHVKQGGQWKLDSVRETEVPAAPAAAVSGPLKQLEWMVGDWIDASPDATVETTVAWTASQAFLTCTFRASFAGAEPLEGTLVIGWDPAAGQFRSWMFDSDGGFGEGTWTRQGDRWSVKFSQVLPDGRKASATNVYRMLDHNTYTWQSIGRQVDGQFAPNIEEVKVVRKGSEPKALPEKRSARGASDTRKTRKEPLP